MQLATKFLLANPYVLSRMPAFLLWMLGLNNQVTFISDLFNRYSPHIFSQDHIKNGIMNLGSSQWEIFNKIMSEINSRLPQAVNGSNQIHTIINGIRVTIRFYLVDGAIKSVDAFVGWATRIIGELLK